MKFFIIILNFIFYSSFLICGQINPLKFEIEKTPFKYSINTGLYKSRLSGASLKENSFKNFSIFAQIYFPFKRSMYSPENFNISEGDELYFERLFSVSPVAIFHITEKLGNALGLGQEMSFKLLNKFVETGVRHFVNYKERRCL